MTQMCVRVGCVRVGCVRDAVYLVEIQVPCRGQPHTAGNIVRLRPGAVICEQCKPEVEAEGPAELLETHKPLLKKLARQLPNARPWGLAFTNAKLVLVRLSDEAKKAQEAQGEGHPAA